MHCKHFVHSKRLVRGNNSERHRVSELRDEISLNSQNTWKPMFHDELLQSNNKLVACIRQANSCLNNTRNGYARQCLTCYNA